MPMTSRSNRHEPIATIRRYLDDNLAGAFGLAGDPGVTLVVEPSGPSLVLEVSATGPEPDLEHYRNLDLDSVVRGTDVVRRLSVTLQGNEAEAYPWLCAIADRIQLGGQSFAAAVGSALESLDRILAGRRGLSHAQQVGLFGELVVLAAFSDCSSPGEAVAAWRGPAGGEHDFGLPEADLEVKTTENERRIHWISSSTQLVPNPDRGLYVVSVQITAAGGGTGRSLPEVVTILRKRMGTHEGRFDELLTEMGYRSADEDLYDKRWLLRSEPQLIGVTEEFPALTRELIDSNVPSSERVAEVSYQIDVTGMSATVGLLLFTGAGLKGLFA